MTQRQTILPITGMTCANCVATVERSLKKQPGVDPPASTCPRSAPRWLMIPTGDLPALVARVKRAGYGVATGEAELIVKRLCG